MRIQDINLPLVINLIAEQFPQWAYLPISPVELSGWDNRIFRLGTEMLIRLPSAEEYALQVQKEQKWLPILAPHLSFMIPEPIAQGHPAKNYPWHWSVYRWIDGASANTLVIDDEHLKLMAIDLARFLNQLHKVDVTGGPPAGPHNFYRGDHPSVYDAETRAAIVELQDYIDVDAVTSIWKKALSSKWNKDPVWVHGDFSSGNILVKDGRITAVIDFGCMGIGDPACDLVIAWTFLKNESRKIFRSHLCLDSDTWVRARGWALWKALITIASIKDKTCAEVGKQQQIINVILDENKLENHL